MANRFERLVGSVNVDLEQKLVEPCQILLGLLGESNLVPTHKR